MKNAVWAVLVFVLALLAMPATGQDAVSAQDEVRAEVTVINERVSAVEASQAKARREALALQRRVAALGKSQDGLSVRATSLEKATVAADDRLKSVESLSVELDRRSANNRGKIANLSSDIAEVRAEVVSTMKLAKWALGVATVAVLPMALMLILIAFVVAWEFWERRSQLRKQELAPSLMDVARDPTVIDEHAAYPQDPSSPAPQEATSLDVADDHDGTTDFKMPSPGPSPTPNDLKVVDEAMDRARQPIIPIRDQSPTQPAA